MFTRLMYSRKPWTNTSSESIISSDNVNKKAPFTLAAFTQGFVCGFACDFKQCKQMYCTEKLHKAKANQLLHSITLLYKNTQAWSHSARIWFAFDSHLIRIWFNQMHLNQMQVQMQMRMNQMRMQVQMHPPRRNQVQVQMQMPHLHLHLQMQVHLSTSLQTTPRCSTMITRNTSNVILSVLTHLNVVRIWPKQLRKVGGRSGKNWFNQRIWPTAAEKAGKQFGCSEMTRLSPNQVTANHVAHQLLVNSRGKPDHHSRRVKLPKAADTCSPRGPSDFTRPFSMNDLCGAIKDMKNNKAAGLDDILCEQIKHLGSAALQWLPDMFNGCMRTNSIPKIWRKSRVVALLKPCKDPASPKSYRPISLLWHTYKLFERLILNRVAPFVDEHLIPEQAGFRPGKSCTSQLLNLTQFIEDGYEEGIITGAAFVDLSATYDTVNHRILTRKFFWDNTWRDAYRTDPEHVIKHTLLCGPRRQTQQMAQTEEWPSTRQRPCPSVVQHNIQMISLFIPTQGVSCTPMIYVLPHRSNPLRRWKRLFVMHSQAWLRTTLPTTSGPIQRKPR